jgi:protein involved in polysaccharide export with SLBB domain
VSGGACLPRLRVHSWILGGLLLPLGSCHSRAIDHSADIAALVEGPKAPESKPSPFEPVRTKERVALAPTEAKPYRLGVGDTVQVKVVIPTTAAGYEAPVSATVKDDGNLYLPIARKVEAKDKTTVEVEEEIVEKLKDYVNAPLVNVEVTNFKARQCRIVGEGVDQEQFIPVDGHLTLLQALIKSGATRKVLADREEAYILRGGKVHPFSIAAIVEQGDTAGDVILEEGDHIVVPSLREREEFVFVLGQVAHPGRFEMDHKARPGHQGHLTLMDAIGLAGGFVEGGVDCNRICVFRGGWRNLKVYQVGVNDIYRDGGAIALEPGDRVYAAPNAAAKFNQDPVRTGEVIRGPAGGAQADGPGVERGPHTAIGTGTGAAGRRRPRVHVPQGDRA